MTTLWDKHHYAECFGHWAVSDPECTRCFVSDNCEKRTKDKVEAEKGCVDQSEEPSEGEVGQCLSPLDYLLQRIGGKLDREDENKGEAVMHKFRDKSGLVTAAVVVGAQGRIKIVSKKMNRIYGSISSVEEAESILAEML
jgi:hypothetical protein